MDTQGFKGLFFIPLLLLQLGCSPITKGKVPTQSPSPKTSQREKGFQLLQSGQYEEAALLFRELLDQMDERGASDDELASVREDAQRAMVEAGGYSDSLRLWSDLAKKNPDNPQAQKMVRRVTDTLGQMADELLLQARDDWKGGSKSKALATLGAAVEVYKKIGGAEERLKAAQTLKESIASGQLQEPEEKKDQ